MSNCKPETVTRFVVCAILAVIALMLAVYNFSAYIDHPVSFYLYRVAGLVVLAAAGMVGMINNRECFRKS